MRLLKDKESNVTIMCEVKSRRGGFAHEVTIFDGDYEIHKERTTYVNRTWEKYPFDSCISHALHKLDEAREIDTRVYRGIKRILQNPR
jgi:hypothetical protein